jgi:hypothetical protein
MSINQTMPASCRYRTTRDLTTSQRWLVLIMSENQFGRIESLRVEDGQPVQDRRQKVVRVARLGTSGGDAPVPAEAEDFELKQSIRDLFDELSRVGNGMVHRLEFRYGLPFQGETTVAADDDSYQQSGVVS